MLRTLFNSFSVISRRQFILFMSFLGFTSTRLGSEVVFTDISRFNFQAADGLLLVWRRKGGRFHITNIVDGWLVVLGFNATLRAMVISRRQFMLFKSFLGFTSTRLGSEVVFTDISRFNLQAADGQLLVWTQKGGRFHITNIVVSWLVVLGFNAILTAKVISWRSMTHMCFLAFSH